MNPKLRSFRKCDVYTTKFIFAYLNDLQVLRKKVRNSRKCDMRTKKALFAYLNDLQVLRNSS